MTTETAATSNYARYWAAPFNRPESYPLAAEPDPARYRPIGQWLGRLILPTVAERQQVMGAWLEVHHAPDKYGDLVGQRVQLRWENTLALNAALWGASRSVVFDDDSREAIAKGTVLAERVNGLVDVTPLESLAGAHPSDDVTVRLQGQVRVDRAPSDGGGPILFATRMPAEVTGRFYALVTFLGPSGQGDGYHVSPRQPPASRGARATGLCSSTSTAGSGARSLSPVPRRRSTGGTSPSARPPWSVSRWRAIWSSTSSTTRSTPTTPTG
ncbi:MAG: hypothetical protein HGA45_07110 [Chloroflexales bacterium]|nr:hypothetical protein [Chloroflexales bacterium]